jgi:ATP-dependent protease ClpP protease subunit
MTEAFIGERLKAIQFEDNRSAAILAAKTGRPVEEVREWQNAELVMNTDAAIKNGIVHGVRPLVIPEKAFFHQVIV